MSKEEIKQYLRNQIDSCIKRQDVYNKNLFHLCYNKQYLRALKLSKITGKPVNKNDFKGDVGIFGVNPEYKEFWYYEEIEDYLDENYSNDYTVQKKIIEEVFNEYDEYKGYNWGGGNIMNKEEIKQWLRSQIDSSIKIQDEYYDKDIFYLYYNKSYVRALKLSKINGKPVNKNNFKEGEMLFGFDTKSKKFWHYYIISDYLIENYSKADFLDSYKLLEEVIHGYDEYKGYNWGW